jgi:chromosome segregation ATPase
MKQETADTIARHLGTIQTQLKKAAKDRAETHRRLGCIEEMVQVIVNQNRRERVRDENMSAQLDALKAKVARNTTVAESAVTLIKGLAQQIRDNADDPAALAALADELDATDTNLGNAVTENTPAA